MSSFGFAHLQSFFKSEKIGEPARLNEAGETDVSIKPRMKNAGITTI